MGRCLEVQSQWNNQTVPFHFVEYLMSCSVLHHNFDIIAFQEPHKPETEEIAKSCTGTLSSYYAVPQSI